MRALPRTPLSSWLWRFPFSPALSSWPSAILGVNCSTMMQVRSVYIRILPEIILTCHSASLRGHRSRRRHPSPCRPVSSLRRQLRCNRRYPPRSRHAIHWGSPEPIRLLLLRYSSRRLARLLMGSRTPWAVVRPHVQPRLLQLHRHIFVYHSGLE